MHVAPGRARRATDTTGVSRNRATMWLPSTAIRHRRFNRPSRSTGIQSKPVPRRLVIGSLIHGESMVPTRVWWPVRADPAVPADSPVTWKMTRRAIATA